MNLKVKVCFLLVYQDVLCKMRHMFDLTEKRPAYWGPMETSSFRSVAERESRQTDRLGEGMREVQLNQGTRHPNND